MQKWKGQARRIHIKGLWNKRLRLYCALWFMLLFSHSVVSNSLWPHGLQHAKLLCSSLSPRVCSNSNLWLILFTENRYIIQERKIHCSKTGAYNSQEARFLQVMLFLQITGCVIWDKSLNPESQNFTLKEQLTNYLCNQVKSSFFKDNHSICYTLFYLFIIWKLRNINLAK